MSPRLLLFIRQPLWVLGRCVAYSLQGAGQRAHNWGPAVAGGIAFFANLAGFKVTFADGSEASALVSALATAAIAWIAIVVLRLVISPWRILRDGSWQGGSFIYHERQFGMALRVSPDDNDKVFSFCFKKAPPHSELTFVYEVDGNRPVQVITVGAENFVRSLRGIATTGHWLMPASAMAVVDKDRRVYVGTYIVPPANAVVVRIYVTSWHYQHVPKSLRLPQHPRSPTDGQ